MDETTARSEIQVPGVGSRDGVDYQLEERDGVLWINAKGSLYMDAAAAPTLFTALAPPTPPFRRMAMPAGTRSAMPPARP
ncbi:MAG: hypothetical protein ACLTYN_08480 [Dysosmobacter welbionis]